jgi:phosphopantothenoylcysteine decarboxylase/phosphopantothenate--cysteine ligase
MGFAIAQAARDMGAEVTLISGPVALTPPAGVDFVSIETTDQMYRAVSRRFAKLDILIMAAAPADFTPAEPSLEKIKKGRGQMQVDLTPTVDILATLGKRKKKQLLVGFALETEDGVANARKKLKAKNLDLIVLNSPRDENSAFGHDTNKMTIIRPGRKPEAWSLMPKDDAALKLLELLESML